MTQTQTAFPRRAAPVWLGALIGLILSFVAVLLPPPPPASALAGVGHGFGYLSQADNVSWLGSYRMDDNTLAFCLEAGRPAPSGHPYSSEFTDRAIGASQDDTARMAYIARRWGQSTDPDEGAAGQLAIWTLAGLHGHSQEFYAARANDRATVVLALARFMLSEADREANRVQDIRLDFDVDSAGRPGVTPQLRITHLDGSTALAPAGTASGMLTVAGATLPGGATSGSFPNGRRVSLTRRSAGATYSLRVDAGFPDVPYGGWVSVGGSVDASQAVLLAVRPTGLASGSGTFSSPSPLPFQPRVSTVTSVATAAAGARVTDRLTLGLGTGEGLLDGWGVYKTGDSFAPIPVTVRSRLLGPFPTAPVLAESWPDDPPQVCSVATVFDAGPTTKSSPACTVPDPGHYVWVETIDPQDTPVDRGRDRVRSWKSRFAESTEVTLVGRAPMIRTRADTVSTLTGQCVSDHLSVAGLPDATSIEVESILVGPFTDPIQDGRDVGADLESLPRAGTTTTTIRLNGDQETSCIRVSRPGHYAFVFRSEGSASTPGEAPIVPAFADLVAHRAEMVAVVAPTSPPTVPVVPPTTPPSVPPVSPAPSRSPRVLAYTGDDGVLARVLVAVGVTGAGAAALLASALIRGARRRKSSHSTDD